MDPGAADPRQAGPSVVVFACGTHERGDDAAGLIAAERLTSSADDRLDVRIVEALEPEHLLELAGRPCVVADCVAGVAPGRIVSLRLEELLPGSTGRPSGASSGPIAARSTHLLPLGDAVALAGLLGGAVPSGRFVGIGGSDFGLGRPLSPEVERGMAAFVAAISAAAADLGLSEAG